MKVKVIGRVFGADGKLIPLGTVIERESADGVIYEQVKTLEVATPKRKRRSKKAD